MLSSILQFPILHPISQDWISYSGKYLFEGSKFRSFCSQSIRTKI